MQSSHVSTLKSSPIFKNIDEGNLNKLTPFLEVAHHKSGEYIHREGDPRTGLKIVLSGSISIEAKRNDHEEWSALYRPGQFFGEGGLLQKGTYHSSNGIAVVASRLIHFPRTGLEQLTHKHPELASQIILNIGAHMYVRVSQTSANMQGAAHYSLGKTRTEKDLLGPIEVPVEAYYGVQTLRAKQNFNISHSQLSQYPTLIKALAQVKLAAANANISLGLIPEKKAKPIQRACAEIIEGHWHNQFIVDLVQGGAGTSTNMNTNEVIANRALEIAGKKKGDYHFIHPNNHINLGQSTNDIYPSAVKVAILHSVQELFTVLDNLCQSLATKSSEFKHTLKMGRTQLQDAVPMTLGQEFEAFRITLEEDNARIKEITQLFHEVNIGGTAIGTKINAHPKYPSSAISQLNKISGFPFKLSANLIEATPDTGSFVMFSGALKRLAIKLSKICNDLRLLSSGPRCGFGEINLPPRQPGSSIMPGKVNPVIPEVVNQVAYSVIGRDLTVTMAAEAGQLQLNVMEPIMVLSLFESLHMLVHAIKTLDTLCIRGITANADRLNYFVEHSIGLVTALNPYIGYENATKVAKLALESDKSVKQVVLEEGLLSEQELENILKPENMIHAK